MQEWWNALTIEQQIFYAIGIVALLFTVIQMILSLIGIGGESLDFDMDTDIDLDGDGSTHSSGIGLLSTQTIAAFFTGLGWGGVSCLSLGLHPAMATFIAFCIGVAFLYLMYFLLVGLMNLQHSGTKRFGTAVGQVGTVYSTINPGRESHGQIQVLVDGRLSTVDAQTDADEPLKPGQSVKVTELLGANTFLVEKN
ncbi:MAG: NfeD family protein [Puniceicoccaceae bacterium]